MSYLTTRQFFFILFIPLTLCLTAQAKPTVLLDRIVAIVNSDLITQEELTQYTNELQAARQQQSLPKLTGKALKKVALQGLIAQRLEEQEAMKQQIQINDAALKRALQTIAKRQNLSLAELRQAVAEQGTPYADYRRQIRQQLILEQLQRQAVGPSVHISQQEIVQQLQQLKQQRKKDPLYHIFDIHFSLAEHAHNSELIALKQQSKRLATELMQADLATIQAKINTLNKVTLTDLGLRRRDQLPSAFVTTATRMNLHTLSAPIQTDNGFHLIYLEQKKFPQSLPDHEEAKRIAYHNKFIKQFKLWLTSLKKNAYIKLI